MTGCSTRQVLRAHPMVFAAMWTVIFGPVGAWARGWMACAYLHQMDRLLDTFICLNVALTSVSVALRETACSWRPASRYTRCT